ncbi:hypothetical protein [Niameybacter massiliensis]|uniref:hypothetical protein n=1 Tax=Niameybacter massiliensis TaxID=1658108 RepID=UPI0006B42154|nr:hypothetical protein [Niameybacter massiliensis]
MQLIGMAYSINGNGEKVTTIHVAEEFNAYYTNSQTGRGCVGMRVESIYVGNYDCSGFKVGMDVDILYDRAITSKGKTFQPIKRIDVLNK